MDEQDQNITNKETKVDDYIVAGDDAKLTNEELLSLGGASKKKKEAVFSLASGPLMLTVIILQIVSAAFSAIVSFPIGLVSLIIPVLYIIALCKIYSSAKNRQMDPSGAAMLRMTFKVIFIIFAVAVGISFISIGAFRPRLLLSMIIGIIPAVVLLVFYYKSIMGILSSGISILKDQKQADSKPGKFAGVLMIIIGIFDFISTILSYIFSGELQIYYYNILIQFNISSSDASQLAYSLTPTPLSMISTALSVTISIIAGIMIIKYVNKFREAEKEEEAA